MCFIEHFYWTGIVAQVVGYKGPAVVVVSCVEDKPPYRTHPHNLVGKDGMCKKGQYCFTVIKYVVGKKILAFAFGF